MAAEGFEPALSHWSAWRWPTGKEFARGGKYIVQLGSTNSRASLPQRLSQNFRKIQSHPKDFQTVFS
ncbi:MAG: hypothetical protein DME97_10760 [Verrucomicrobia bacterium]|nr:MAG: hypothetical protein DME97_10760 [Verrucomicrobiota bacterium]